MLLQAPSSARAGPSHNEPTTSKPQSQRSKMALARTPPPSLLVLGLAALAALAWTTEAAPQNPESSSSGDPSSLVWQPIRATFRPLNRQPPALGQPEPPAPPTPPSLPAGWPAGGLGEPGEPEAPLAPPPRPFVSVTGRPGAPSPTPPPPPPPPPEPTEAPEAEREEEQPTRVPLTRFRPTRAPSVEEGESGGGGPLVGGPAASGSANRSAPFRISDECFECICEASTSCNAQSRCQTSDVRHTRCGMFLISYDQWLETGLSRQLVSREQLARDAAADERAFYECVTDRVCAERLLAIYMRRQQRDCDKDGRIDCYDLAALHQTPVGEPQCQSEALLDSQYWSDFNACYGFYARS